MADENLEQPDGASGASGCSLGCASVFVLAAVISPLFLIFTKSYEPDLMFFPFVAGALSFVVGHILAIGALSSRSPASRRMGKRSLQLMWGGIGVFAVVILAAIAVEHLLKK